MSSEYTVQDVQRHYLRLANTKDAEYLTQRATFNERSPDYVATLLEERSRLSAEGSRLLDVLEQTVPAVVEPTIKQVAINALDFHGRTTANPKQASTCCGDASHGRMANG